MSNKTDKSVLLSQVEQAKKLVPLGAHFMHYKQLDKPYVIQSIAILEATEEVVICYAPLATPDLIFVRPFDAFLQDIEVDGKHIPRFTRIAS
jgi:hypothetical protein